MKLAAAYKCKDIIHTETSSTPPFFIQKKTKVIDMREYVVVSLRRLVNVLLRVRMLLLHLWVLDGSTTGLRNTGGRAVLRCGAHRWTIRLRSKLLVLHAITGLDVLALLGLIETSGSLRLLAIWLLKGELLWWLRLVLLDARSWAHGWWLDCTNIGLVGFVLAVAENHEDGAEDDGTDDN